MRSGGRLRGLDSLAYLRLLVKHRANPLHAHYLAGKRVLDVGCGLGDFIAKDKDRRVGVDLNADLVKACNSRGLVAHCMSATKLNFPDESFDAVHAAELVEHLCPEDAASFLSEASRVLKKGGLVYLTTPSEYTVWNTFSHVRPYPPIAFSKLLNRATEAFVHEAPIPLALERGFAFKARIKNPVVSGLIRAWQITLPPSRPQGYVIVLRKH
jgi:SAM-dependent methyltransferase